MLKHLSLHKTVLLFIITALIGFLPKIEYDTIVLNPSQKSTNTFLQGVGDAAMMMGNGWYISKKSESEHIVIDIPQFRSNLKNSYIYVWKNAREDKIEHFFIGLHFAVYMLITLLLLKKSIKT